jgi:AraC-like DNA-binding protein
MDKRIALTRALLEEEWRQPHRIADLAAAVNLAPSRLQHLFKAVMKVSIRELVQRRRLEEAALLLVSTHERISLIAYSVGFHDISNFNHAFRRQFGMCPREYRRASWPYGLEPVAHEAFDDGLRSSGK